MNINDIHKRIQKALNDARKTPEYTQEGVELITAELPKAREGWVTKHPVTNKMVEVVTREDYDFLLSETTRLLLK